MAPRRDSGPTVRLARWSARRPWRALAGWVVFVALGVGAGVGAGTNQGTISAFWIGEAGRAEAIAAAAALSPPEVENILVTSTAGAPAESAAVEDVTGTVRAVPGVAGVGAAVRSADGGTLRIPVTMAGTTDDAREAVQEVLDRVERVRAGHPGVRIQEAGGPSISVGVNAKQGADLARTEAVSLPVTFVILFVVFGAVLAAGVPVLVALSAFAGSVGLYGLASWVFPDAGGAAISVVFMLGMAVGVDYSLFTLKRVREERERAGGAGHVAAVQVAVATAGRAVVTSGTAVVVSLAGLYLADDVIFSSIATGAVLVVAVSVVGSLTALPALLVLLGDRIDGRLRRRSRHRAPAGGAWTRVLGPALRRPVATLLVAGAVTAALAWPATSMRLGVEGKETFPASVPAVAAYADLTRLFPDQGAHHLVAVRAAPAQAGAVRDALADLAGRTAGDPLYAGTPEIRTSADGATSTFRIAVPHPENSAAAVASARRLRELLPQALGAVPGVEYAMSGEIARGLDYSAHQAERIPWVIGFVGLATLLVMVAAFGSVVLAVLGVVANAAAVVVAWGVLALVFQHTWAEGPLGFTSPGFVGSRMPLMVLAILVGLSTDYQIFVVSRIREAVRAGVPTRRAVAEGIAATAGTVTSAAVIMISVFAGFLFIDRIELKEVAVALTSAVLFDAVVLRILILPAAMTLLGERAWWPRHPGRTGSVEVGPVSRSTGSAGAVIR